MAPYNLALGYLRAFVTVLVLVHHSILAYVTFGRFDAQHYLSSTAPIVDSRRWFGFDVLVLFNDIYFMSLMFLLSGLFVWPSLARKGAARFVRDRLLRLGLPFALVVTLLMPLAYYPSFRMTGMEVGYLEFWRQTLLTGPWPGGPAWFVWLLLAFDGIAAGLYRVLPQTQVVPNPRVHPMLSRPALFFAALVAGSLLIYLPMVSIFGATLWFTVGPFSVWACRLLLYAAYFFLGVALGGHGLERTLLAHDGALARSRVTWVRAGLVSFAVAGLLQLARMGHRFPWPEAAWQMLYGVVFVVACAALGMGWLALFLRHANRQAPLFDRLRDNAYGMYLIHYVFVIWLQFALLEFPLPAVAKAVVVFTVTLAFSWGTVAALRSIPAVARVL